MITQYNILIIPKFNNNIALSVQRECIRATEKFLGEHYVNQFGRMFDGLDKNCDTYYEAKFDFFNRYEKGTLDDAIKRQETKRLLLDGDEQVGFEQNRNFMKVKNILEVKDPTMFFYDSWGKYRNSTMPEPFKINTPLGAQDTHVHIIPSLNIVRFYKPYSDMHWYDYDMLRDFASDADFTIYNLKEKQRETSNIIIKYFIIPKQMRQVKKVAKYKKRLWQPESIDKIDISDNYKLPEINEEQHSFS